MALYLVGFPRLVFSSCRSIRDGFHSTLQSLRVRCAQEAPRVSQASSVSSTVHWQLATDVQGLQIGCCLPWMKSSVSQALHITMPDNAYAKTFIACWELTRPHGWQITWVLSTSGFTLLPILPVFFTVTHGFAFAIAERQASPTSNMPPLVLEHDT